MTSIESYCPITTLCVCVDICIDMRVGMCIDMRVGICIDMRVDMVQTCA